MKEKLTNLIYAARAICEIIRDRNSLDSDEEISDCLSDLESALDEIGEEASDE